MAGTTTSTVRVDNFTRFCLGAITVLLVVMALTLWVQTPSAPSAHAAEELFNTSAQRQEIVDTQKETNKRLDELIDLLKSGDVKVQVQDNKSDKHENN